MTKIFVAGHNGMVGSSLVNLLKKNKKNKIITCSKKKLNLLDKKKTYNFIKKNKPDQIYIAAAKVGGIKANNDYPVDFIYENIMIEFNLIYSAYLNNVKKILFLGSSCIYPKFPKIPIKEESLLTGLLETSNEPYALAKIAGIKLCSAFNKQYKKKNLDYRSVMPCNLYGPKDNFDPNFGHVIPSLIHKFHYAKIANKKEVVVWGNGKSKREFMHVDDLAEASIFLMNLKKKIFFNKNDFAEHVNIGTGKEIAIKDLVYKIKNIIGFRGKIIFDKKKLNGTPRKVLNNKKIKKLGWEPKIKLTKGLIDTYEYFKLINAKKK